MLIVHHRQNPRIRACALGASFPLAADEPARAILAHPGLVGQFPVVDVFAAAVAAHVGDAALVVVAGSHAGVAVVASVVLACPHEGGEVGVFAFGGWGHAVVRVGVVGCEGGGAGLVVIFLEVVHGK